MAVTLTGSTGAYFARLGHLAGFLADIVAMKGGSATARVLSGASALTRGTTLEADAAASPAVSRTYDGHWTAIASWQASQSGIFSQIKTLAENLTVEQVNLDASLNSKDVTSALTELIRQMRASSSSVNASTVAAGAQTAQGTPTGNPVVVLAAKNARGDTLQTMFAETLRFSTTGDAQTGSTARQEAMSARGQPAVADAFSHLWPGGSGCSVSLALVDARLDNAGGNKLYNSDFETFTANYPEDWVIGVGAAGTDVLAAGSTDAYGSSTNALKLTGDGSTLSCLRQTFNRAHSTTSSAGGTPYAVLPGKRYAVNCFMKAITSAPLAGVLRVRLVDGSDAVVNDDAGNANSFTVDLTTLTTTHAAKSGVFCTPSVLPSQLKLELALTTALTAAKSVVLDDLAMAEMTQLYAGGPAVAAFAGSTQTYVGDVWTVATTNTMGAMAMWLERLFSLRDKGLQFPYSGSPTVADSLVS